MQPRKPGALGQPTPDPSPRGPGAPTRESQIRERTPTPTPATAVPELREARKRAVTLRNQGWRWELTGRAAGLREAAEQVRKWLLERGSAPTEADVRWVVQLLEQSAEVYEAGGEPKKG